MYIYMSYQIIYQLFGINLPYACIVEGLQVGIVGS